MKKKKRLLREGKLRERCQEPLHFACNECGEPFSQADWQNNSGYCPACMDGSPAGCASCATCKENHEELKYDPQGPIETKPRPCHSVAVFERTGKVVFDPSGESEGHDIIPPQPAPVPAPSEKEHPPKPGPKPSPSPHQPFYIDIVVTCIGTAVGLFFAGFGIPTDGLRDPSLAYAAGIAVLTAFLTLKLCRSRFKPGKKKPGKMTTSVMLAVLVLITSFYSLQQHTDLLLSELILYTSLVACASYSLTRLAFKRVSILLALASTLIAGYLFATTHWVTPSSTFKPDTSQPEKSELDSSQPKTSPPDTSQLGTATIVSPPEDFSTSEALQAADSPAETLRDTAQSRGATAHSGEVFTIHKGQEYVSINGKIHLLDLPYEKIQIAPKLYPLIKPQRDIFRDYEKALTQLLKARTQAELAENYREFLAWKKENGQSETTAAALAEEEFKKLNRSVEGVKQVHYTGIGQVLRSGRAYRMKIDTIIEQYRHWHRQSIATSEQTFDPNLPWDELRADFEDQLTRVRNNLAKFPKRL